MGGKINIDDYLKDVSTVGIAGHVRPDGDCAGSTLAMYNYILKKYPNIEATIMLEEIPDKFEFLTNSDKIVDAKTIDKDKKFDLFICQDCGDAKRLGDYAYHFFANATTTVCIDHHVSNSSFADVNYIVPDASSTSELIYEVIDKSVIDKAIAECIYIGIVHDTGLFAYSSTAKRTMEIAGELMSKGIDFPTIIDKTFYERTFKQSRILGHALSKAKLWEKERCASSYITKEEMAEFGVTVKELDVIVTELRVNREVEVAIFLYELEGSNGFKVSTRCKGDLVDLSQIAMKYKGGGHKKAAGFTVYTDDPQKAIEMIVADCYKQLKESESRQ